MVEPLAAALEQTILAHRSLPVPSAWADEIVFPYYDGLSIINLAHTAIRLLDGGRPTERLGTLPLDSRLWEHLWGQAKRVVLFISDGLGWRLLQEIIAGDPVTAQVVADLTGDGTLTPLTSVVPSTTAAALPSIWTGAAPATTGMIGTRLFLREFNLLADLLYYRPLCGKHRPDVLEEWGLNFDNFIPVVTLGQLLSARGIPTYVLLQQALFGSGLSRIMHRGVRHVVRHFGYTDMWIGLRDLLRQTRGERCFVNIYWGGVDGVSHLYGTASEQSITEVRRQLTDLRDTLAADGIADGRTLFMFAADHGHTPVPDYINLADHAPIDEALRCGLGGEGRLPYCYLRHDFRQPVIDYVCAALGDKVTYLIPSDVLGAGLFGTEKPYAETAARLGDLVLVPRQGSAVGEHPPRVPSAASRHGGLTDREMLVPLLMRML